MVTYYGLRAMFVTLIVAGVNASCLLGQESVPRSTQRVSASLVTAAERTRETRMLRQLEDPDVMADMRPGNPIDSVLSLHAREWARSLNAAAINGIQIDAAGELSVIAGDEQAAQEQFAKRLATPNLSITDRAYTLGLAATAFAAPVLDTMRARTRLRLALEYLLQLDAMPASVARYRYNAHTELARSRHAVGDAKGVITHVLAALDRVPDIPFEERQVPNSFYWLADALSGQPNGRARIDSVGQRWKALLQASPELIARNPGYARRSAELQRDLGQILKFTSYLGRPAPPIVAQYWWNTEAPSTKNSQAPGALELSLNDGKVRLIELGSVSCYWCLVALNDMDRIHATLPKNAEAWYVTRGYGFWGANPCSADFEAERLKQFYLTDKKRKLPIALWIGTRTVDEDGGSLVANNPFWDAMGVEGGPIFLVVDGRGIVRHAGTNAIGLEPELRAVHFLLAEAEGAKTR